MSNAGRPIGPHRGASARWKRLREWVLARDGHACVLCGSTGPLAIDHIMPRARGGQDVFENLRVLCKRCNASKSYKRPVLRGRLRHLAVMEHPYRRPGQAVANRMPSPYLPPVTESPLPRARWTWNTTFKGVQLIRKYPLTPIH